MQPKNLAQSKYKYKSDIRLIPKYPSTEEPTTMFIGPKEYQFPRIHPTNYKIYGSHAGRSTSIIACGHKYCKLFIDLVSSTCLLLFRCRCQSVSSIKEFINNLIYLLKLHIKIIIYVYD